MTNEKANECSICHGRGSFDVEDDEWETCLACDAHKYYCVTISCEISPENEEKFKKILETLDE